MKTWKIILIVGLVLLTVYVLFGDKLFKGKPKENGNGNGNGETSVKK